jgi:hypothetical protein
MNGYRVKKIVKFRLSIRRQVYRIAPDLINVFAVYLGIGPAAYDGPGDISVALSKGEKAYKAFEWGDGPHGEKQKNNEAGDKSKSPLVEIVRLLSEPNAHAYRKYGPGLEASSYVG